METDQNPGLRWTEAFVLLIGIVSTVMGCWGPVVDFFDGRKPGMLETIVAGVTVLSLLVIISCMIFIYRKRAKK